jgi:peptidyl-prolyl cis-trans isomerase D
MLTAIKERASGWIAWALVILISIPFALWGINSYFEGASKVSVASVNGVDLEDGMYQQALSERRRAMVQIMGRNVDADFFASTTFKLQVLESLIDSNLQAEYLRDRGYRLTDEQLSKRIGSFEAFQVDGQFDPVRYEQLVQNAGLSLEAFEGQQRQQGAVDQLRAGLRDSSLVVSSMTDRAIALLFQVRRGAYAILEIQDFEQMASVEEDAIRKEFDDHSDRYIAPEQMQVEFIRLSVDELARQAVVTEAEQRDYYAANADRFTQPGSRSARHILLTVPSDANDETVETVRGEAEQLIQRIRSGEDFAEIAKVSSKDPGSAGRGGDLGIIRPGTMAPAFEEAVFALAESEISAPVRTSYGWHVIQLTDLRESSTKPFEEVSSEIKGTLEREWAEAKFVAMAEDFQNLIFEQPGSLLPAADFLGLTVQRSEWFSRDEGEGVAAEASVREAAFSNDVRVDGLNSEMLEIGNDTLVAIHFADFRDERKKTFDEVRVEIADALKALAAAELQEAEAKALVDKLRDGGAWGDVLGGRDLQTNDLPEDLDNLTDPRERAVAGIMYSAPAPVDGDVAYGYSALGSSYVIYRLDAVIPGNPAEITQTEADQVKMLIETRVGEELYSGLSRALRASADVQIFEENL